MGYANLMGPVAVLALTADSTSRRYISGEQVNRSLILRFFSEMMSILRIVLIFAFMLVDPMPILAQEAVEEPLSRSEVEKLESIFVEIKADFFYEIPKEKHEEAIGILASEPIVELNAKQVASVLGQQPDIQIRIQKIVERYQGYAVRDEADALNPNFAKLSAKILQNAKTSIKQAKYYRDLAGQVRPFLLMGIAAGRNNAAFYGIKRGNTLKVIHSYLGCCLKDNPIPVPLIVYLKDKPEKIETSTLGVK